MSIPECVVNELAVAEDEDGYYSTMNSRRFTSTPRSDICP